MEKLRSCFWGKGILSLVSKIPNDSSNIGILGRSWVTSSVLEIFDSSSLFAYPHINELSLWVVGGAMPLTPEGPFPGGMPLGFPPFTNSTSTPPTTNAASTPPMSGRRNLAASIEREEEKSAAQLDANQTVVGS